MGAKDPRHPVVPSVSLTGVSLAGAGSTIGDGELTTGEASLGKAYAAARQPQASGSPTLLEAYRRWQAAQEATAKAAAPAGDPEAVAYKKSRKRLRKLIAGGASPAAATIQAHQHYRKHGGRSGIEVWSRRIAAGR